MPPTNEPKLLQLSQLLDAFAEDANRRHEAKRGGIPISALTGFPQLDSELGGAMAPGLHILHGSPGSGKTAFALQMACTCQCPALFVTCEMPPIELLRRVAARVTGTYLGKFKSGELDPHTALGYAKRAVAAAPHLGIVDATDAPVTPGQIAEFAAVVKQVDPTNPHLLLIVDSVHAWTRPQAGSFTEYDSLNIALDALRVLAQRLNCPVLGIGERNRASIKDGGQSASAGTRTFEYSSESVIELNAKDKDHVSGEREVDLKLSKNRNGTQGKIIKVLFKGATQSFREA